MGAISINELKARFATRDIPTQKDYTDLIDTLIANINAATGSLTPGGAFFYKPATLSGSIYVASYLPAVTAYSDGTVLAFKANASNPSGVTQFDAGPGPAILTKQNGLNLDAGDIQASQIVEVRYEGVAGIFQVTSALFRGTVHKAGDIILSSWALPEDGTRLLCDGRTVSLITYPALSVIGSGLYGIPSPNDLDHVKLPNLIRKFPIGADLIGSPGTPAIPPGASGGEERHALAILEVTPHLHGIADKLSKADEDWACNIIRSWSDPFGTAWTMDINQGDGAHHQQVATGTHATGRYASTNAIEDTGRSVTPHNNLPPYVGMYYYILT